MGNEKETKRTRRTLTLKDRVADIDARIEKHLAAVRELRSDRQSLLDAAKAEASRIAQQVADAEVEA